MKSLNDGVQMRNVWELPLCMGDERVRVDGRTAHAAQKPEALLFRVISASSNPGDVVLDPFSGTGTTAAVARRLGRRFIGIEQDPAFVELSRARVAGVTPVGAEDLARAPSRRELPKVPFGALLEQGLLTIGATLTSRDGTRSAVVQADGTLRCADGFVGSIHRAGAHVQGLPACNGWDFWHVQDAEGARAAPIQRLREQAQARLRTGTVAAEGDLRA
jgi:modification methylase